LNGDEHNVPEGSVYAGRSGAEEESTHDKDGEEDRGSDQQFEERYDHKRGPGRSEADGNENSRITFVTLLPDEDAPSTPPTPSEEEDGDEQSDTQYLTSRMRSDRANQNVEGQYDHAGVPDHG
jgi:hypothetical protein